MLEEMRKLCLAAVGAAAMTYDKTIELINDLVEKGKITVEEGKELSEELKKNIIVKAEAAKTKANDMKPLTKDNLQESIQKLNLATKSDIEDLKIKISELDKKVNNK
ncbi:MAG: hypothetical protein E7208_13230 [Clostridium butyricum]|nr:hypothetical protein [Clostridium butyricum]